MLHMKYSLLAFSFTVMTTVKENRSTCAKMCLSVQHKENMRHPGGRSKAEEEAGGGENSTEEVGRTGRGI